MIVFIALLAFALHGFVIAKYSKSILEDSTKDFLYLDRFCFRADNGMLQYKISYPADMPKEMLLLYYDTDDQWPKAYKELQTCEERVQLLQNNSENNQIIYLDPYESDERTGGSKCRLNYDEENREWITCSGERTFRSVRSRWWFLAIAACDEDSVTRKSNISSGILTVYELHMTNGIPSDLFHHEFSDDEWLILPSDVGFLATDFILLAVTYVVGFQLSSRRLYHNIYRIYVQSIVFETSGLVACVFASIIYSTDGVGMPFLKQMGQLLRGAAYMMFVFMCLLLSRGLNVTKMKLGKADNCFITLMVVIFLTSYFGMLLWEIRGFDPATVYYPGESIPGWLLAGWRIVAWIFFTAASIHSAKIYPNKRSFFTNFVILMTPWFWAGPINNVIASYVLNNWVRASVVNIVENCVIFYGYAVFLWLARPTIDNSNFPFHIRTTQVDVGIDPNEVYTANPKDEHHWTGTGNATASAPQESSESGERTSPPLDDITPPSQFTPQGDSYRKRFHKKAARRTVLSKH